MFFPLQLFREHIAVTPLHEDTAGTVTDELAGFVGLRKVELFAGGEDRVLLRRLRSQQRVKLAEVSRVELRLVQQLPRIEMTCEEFFRLCRGDLVSAGRCAAIERSEYHNRARLGVSALAVAAPGGLNNRVEWPKR